MHIRGFVAQEIEVVDHEPWRTEYDVPKGINFLKSTSILGDADISWTGVQRQNRSKLGTRSEPMLWHMVLMLVTDLLLQLLMLVHDLSS